MAPCPGDITGWYNNEALHPDLHVAPSDGETVKVHSVIVCKANKWFEEAFSTARKVGRDKPLIVVPGSEVAVTTVLRSYYGFPLPSAKDLSWGDWIDLVVVAGDLAEHTLRDQARVRFLSLALDERDVDEIFNMLYLLDQRMGFRAHAQDGLARMLRRHHCLRLIPNPRYRRTLALHPEMMMQHLDDFVNKAEHDRTAQ